MKKKSKHFIWVLVILLFIVFLGGGAYAFHLYKLYMLPNFSVKTGDKVELYITKETQLDDIVDALQIQNALIDVNAFKKLALLKGLSLHLKQGHYCISDGMTNRAVVNKLLSGAQTPVKLTFNNIRFKQELAQKISSQLALDSVSIMDVLENTTNFKKYGVNSETIMGLFIPNTYEVYWTTTPNQLLERMYKEYTKFWNTKRLEKAKECRLSPMQVITLASIVEEETNKSYEKPIVAGLYINRLHRGIPLQSDPTVRFAIGNFGVHRILFEHLEYQSPYNTYLNTGLPPGPIRLPSIQGIDAVLNYQRHAYIYMCAKPTLNGEHNFARTLSQHNRNAQAYHRALRKWERKNKK